ncbi:MAG: metal ABC transporter substrate-binding protein [Chloroflexota bacterium]
MKPTLPLHFALFALLLLTACVPGASPTPPSSPAPGKIRVVATTTIVGDVVRNIGGEAIALDVLLPINADPHSFQPTPRDAAIVSEAQVIFANGAGLEAFLEPLLNNANSQARQVSVSEGISLLAMPENHDDHEEHEGEEHEHEHAGGDPHTWIDPYNVMVWVKNIQSALSEIDPQNASLYQKNAEQYLQSLNKLDLWVRRQVDQIPQENRILVTDHQVFGYFAARYGFEQIGTIVPGYSTLSQPSAQELAELEDAIRALGVPTIFVGNTVNPTLAERVANDTGTQLVFIYTGSLTDADGPAPTYLDYIRFNVNALVSALK